MTLQISRDKKPTYTYKEILEDRYPELFEQAEEQRNCLAELQSKVIALLPNVKIIIPNRRYLQVGIHSVEAQTCAQEKIVLHSLYNFADKAYIQIKNMCEVLAEAINSNNCIAEEDAHVNLEDALDKLTVLYHQFGGALLENLGVVGLLRLQRIADYMGTKYNLYDWSAVGSWTFRDVVGTVTGHGYFGSDLLFAALAEPIPTAVTIGEVAENSTMLRIY